MSNEFNNYLTKIHKNFTLVKKDFKKHKFTLKEGFITFTVDLKNINCSMCNTKDLNICSLKKCSHIYRLFNELYNVPNDKLHFLWLNDNYKSILEKSPLEIAAKKHELIAYKHEGFWQCMDTKRDKDNLEKTLKQKKKFE